MTALGAARARVRVGHLLFLANFALAKGAIYLMPLLLAAVSSELLYGRLELGLAIGLQAGALVLGASLSGITQRYLVHGERAFGGAVVMLTLAPTGALLAAGGATWMAGGSAATLLTIATVSTTMLQTTASTWFRIRGQRNAAAWFDGASLLIVGAAALSAVLIAGPDAVGLTAALLFGLMAALAVAATAAWWRVERDPEWLGRVRRATVIGLPMMVAGLFAVWIGVGGRILIGVLSPADLAAYSLAFRIGGLTLGLHQLASIAVFPRLYASRVRAADRLLGGLLAAVLALSLCLLIIAPLLPGWVRFASLDEAASATFRALVPPAIVHTFFFIGFALLQGRINRFGVAKRSILPLLSVTAAGIVAIVIVAHAVSNDVRAIAWMIAGHAAVYFVTAHLILSRRRVPHLRTASAAAAGGVLLSLVGAAQALW